MRQSCDRRPFGWPSQLVVELVVEPLEVIQVEDWLGYLLVFASGRVV